MRQHHLCRIWEFNTANFRVTVDCYHDDDVDLSFDDTGEIKEKLESGEFTAFWTEVKVMDSRGGVLGRDTLGGSIYADPREFRDHVGLAQRSRADGTNYGSYFLDMVREAISEARKTVLAMNRVRVRDPEASTAPAPGI